MLRMPRRHRLGYQKQTHFVLAASAGMLLSMPLTRHRTVYSDAVIPPCFRSLKCSGLRLYSRMSVLISSLSTHSCCQNKQTPK